MPELVKYKPNKKAKLEKVQVKVEQPAESPSDSVKKELSPSSVSSLPGVLDLSDGKDEF